MPSSPNSGRARRSIWLSLLVGLLLAAGCGSAGEERRAGRLQSEPVTTQPPESTSVSAAATTTVPEPVPDRAEEVLATLSVEEKIGQLFMPVVWGTDAVEVSATDARNNEAVFGYRTPAEIVEAYHLGGIMYLGHNIASADQVGALSAGLQDVAVSSDSGVGMLVAIDQEGGRVNRLTDGVTVFPPAAVLSGDSAAVQEAGYLTGTQVSGQGINVVLAPVADLATADSAGVIGNRSYGDDPVLVADMVTAAVDGLQGSGVAAAVKHWPGHGSTEVDSHDRLPVLDVTLAEWEDRERVPFEAAVATDVAIVLVGHLALPEIDPDGMAATVSPTLIDEQLRQRLEFDGVVMTDALNMGAISSIDPGEVVVQSVIAGADVQLYPPDLPLAYQAMVDAVATGELTEELLDASVLRVLRLKDALGLLPVA